MNLSLLFLKLLRAHAQLFRHPGRYAAFGLNYAKQVMQHLPKGRKAPGYFSYLSAPKKKSL